ncbi:MAG: alpha amylase N-terminal ig-like domain-containing protein [Roseburia sp.]
MNLAEITHRAYFLDCYPLDERHLKISIQTGKDVDEVILWAGDPYSAGIAENEQNWQGERVPMELERELAHRNVYSAVLTPAYRRVKYHFEITGGGESVCLYEDGFVKAGENFPADRMIQRFIYPWMNRADVMKVPEWAENIVWYQIFPDRFCRKIRKKSVIPAASGHARRIRPGRSFTGVIWRESAAALPILQTLASEAST